MWALAGARSQANRRKTLGLAQVSFNFAVMHLACCHVTAEGSRIKDLAAKVSLYKHHESLPGHSSP